MPLAEDKLHHLSHTVAPLLRHAETAGWAELQFENLTERLALAYLKADTGEVEKLRERIAEHLSLLPEELAEIRPHREALAFARSEGFWQHLDYARIMRLQQTFAPLMRYRQRRERGQIIQISLPDKNAQRHWIVFGPGGEGCFADSYRSQVEALVLGLAEANPALRKLRQGQDVDDEELQSVASQLSGPDWFVSEQRLREAYDQPSASFADFLRHILGETKLPSREAKISQSFDAWVNRHPTLSATQLMFIRTLRHALIQRAEVASIESLRQPPFTTIGDPETLFQPDDLREIINLALSLAA